MRDDHNDQEGHPRVDDDKNNGHGAKNRGVTNDGQRMLDVIRTMYLHNGIPSCRPMREVAEELGMPYQQVNAFVQKGLKENLISPPPVHLPYEVGQTNALESAVQRRWGLKRVILVPGYAAMLDNLEQGQRRRLHTAVIHKMAPRAAALLDEIVLAAARAERDCNVSVAWGRTMKLFADLLHETHRPIRWSRLRVLPLLGPTAWAKTDPVEADIVAQRVAQAFGGSWARLPCPAFVLAEYFATWMALPEVAEVLKHLRESHCVITSLGPIPASADADPVDVTLSNDPAMSKAMAEDARTAGAIGEINFGTFGANGETPLTKYRAIGLGVDGHKMLSADPARWVILMCGGDRYRLEALKAALTIGLCNVLISDTVSARYLVDEPQPPREVAYSMPQDWATP